MRQFKPQQRVKLLPWKVVKKLYNKDSYISPPSGNGEYTLGFGKTHYKKLQLEVHTIHYIDNDLDIVTTEGCYIPPCLLIPNTPAITFKSLLHY